MLASESERRKELLSWLGIPFEVKVSGFDETGISADDVRVLVGTLATAKAQTVADKFKLTQEEMINSGTEREKELAPQKVEPTFVLGADTVVYFEGEVLGKPDDIDHAREILTKLRGKTHEVYSGVALVDVLGQKKKAVTEVSEVAFRDFSDEELENYLATSEPLGKAGGYMIMGKGKELVGGLVGSVTNVTGLPLMRVVDLLNEFGVLIDVDVEGTVMRKTGYSS